MTKKKAFKKRGLASNRFLLRCCGNDGHWFLTAATVVWENWSRSGYLCACAVYICVFWRRIWRVHERFYSLDSRNKIPITAASLIISFVVIQLPLCPRWISWRCGHIWKKFLENSESSKLLPNACNCSSRRQRVLVTRLAVTALDTTMRLVINSEVASLFSSPRSFNWTKKNTAPSFRRFTYSDSVNQTRD